MNPQTTDLVPTSSPPRPAAGDDLRNRPRPSSPTPLGDEVELESNDEHPTNPSTSSHGTRSHDHFNNGTVWLVTERTKPAWEAALHLLDDGTKHDLLDLRQAMHDAADLAPRTITNHLRSAARRGWITLRHGKVQLRNRELVEQALDLTEGRADG